MKGGGEGIFLVRDITWHDVGVELEFCVAVWILAGLLMYVGQYCSTCRCCYVWCERTQLRLEEAIAHRYYVVHFVAVMALLSLIQCSLFVSGTYTHSVSFFGVTVDVVASILYGTDTLFRIIVHEQKLTYSEIALDAFVVPSSLNRGVRWWLSEPVLFSFGFLSCVRAILCYQRLMGYLSDFVGKGNVSLQMFTLILNTVTVFYLTASIFYLLETIGDLPFIENWMRTNEDGQEVITFFSALYFCFVTFSTVGYGDILPTTVLARIVTISFIIGGIAAFTIGTNELLEVMRLNRVGRGAYVSQKGISHVIVTGNPNFAMMKDFLIEFFHPDHEALGIDSFKVIFLLKSRKDNPYDPSMEMESLVGWLSAQGSLRIKKQTIALQGSMLEHADLERVQAAQAKCIFILPDMQSSNPFQEDADNILRVLAVKRFRKDLRLLCLLLRGEHKSLLLTSGLSEEDVVVVDAFKMEMLGKNCAVPGFLPLICNLFRSETEESANKATSHWQREYLNGAARELYFTTLSAAYQGWRFPDVVLDILNLSNDGNVVLLGVTYETGTLKQRRMIVNPGKEWKVPSIEGVMGMFIASDLESIKQRASASRPALGGRSYHHSWKQAMTKTITLPSNLHIGSGTLGNVGLWRPDARDFNDVVSSENIVTAQACQQKPVSHMNVPPAILSIFDRLDEREGQNEDAAATVMQKVRDLKVKFTSSELNKPPEKVLSRGGHVLIAWPSSSEKLGAVGLEQFVRPLRAPHISSIRPIVIVAPEPPEDWPTVRQYDHVYFIKGSALSLPAMEEAKFREASSIVVLRISASRADDADSYMVDADVIFSMRQIEAHLPRGSTVYTVAEIAIDANGEYLTQEVAPFDSLLLPEVVEELTKQQKDHKTDTVGNGGQNGSGEERLGHALQDHLGKFTPRPERSQVQRHGDASQSSPKFEAMSSEVWAKGYVGAGHAKASHPLSVQDPSQWATHAAKRVYEDSGRFGHSLEESKYIGDAMNLFRTSRFASGQLFVTSVLISLMVNTFHNPEDTRLIQTLLSSELQLLRVPGQFIQRPYAELVAHFLRTEGILSIGLYRNRSRKISRTNVAFGSFFVSAAPPGQDTALHEDDYVFGIVPAFRQSTISGKNHDMVGI